MRRRRFIAGLGVGTLAPLSRLAQGAPSPVIGFLNTGSSNEFAHLVEAFRQGLKEGGYVDGKNVAIEYRWAEGRYERLPELARDLVNRKVAVIAATGGTGPALAAKSITSIVPIVFTGGGDPVKQGLVASLSHPGGNLTGVVNLAVSIQAKRFQIMRELVPATTRVAYLRNPNNPDAAIAEVEAAAKASGTHMDLAKASTQAEIDNAFASISQRIRAQAVFVAPDPFFMNRREQIVRLAARYAIPASYPFREFPTAGGLMSYGPDIADGYRQAGVYAARILKGAKPADLPVIQATKIELVVNLKTAKTLRLNISRDFLARVDEVIQ